MTGVATLAFVVVAGYELDDHLSREGYSMLDEIRLWKAGGQCVYAGRTDNLRTEAQKNCMVCFGRQACHRRETIFCRRRVIMGRSFVMIRNSTSPIVVVLLQSVETM